MCSSIKKDWFFSETAKLPEQREAMVDGVFYLSKLSFQPWVDF